MNQIIEYIKKQIQNTNIEFIKKRTHQSKNKQFIIDYHNIF